MSKNRKLARWWFGPWEYRQAKAWLEDYAAKGWQLEFFGLIFTSFQKCEPALIKYKCVLGNSPYEEEQKLKDAYKEAGWKFIDKKLEIMLVFSQEASDSSVTDPTDQTEQLKLTRRSLRGKFMKFIVSIIAFIGFLFFSYYEATDAYMFANYFIKHELHTVFILTWFISYWITCIRPIKLLFSLKKLDECDQISTVNIKKKFLSRAVCYIIAFIILVPGPIFIVNIWTFEFPAKERFRISDVIPAVKTENTYKQTDSLESTIQFGIMYPYHISYYDSADNISDKEDYILMGFEEYMALTPGLADYLAEKLTDQYWFLRYKTKADSQGFDKLWVDYLDVSNWRLILAVQGNHIYYFQIRGPMGVDEMITYLKGYISNQ